MKNLFMGIIAASFFSIFFTWPLFGYLDQPLGNKEGILFDYLLDVFVFEHNLTHITNLEFDDFLNTRMFYPYEKTWAFGNTYLPQSVLGLPVYLLTKNVIFATNSVIIINFWLTFLSMYLLAYFLSKNLLASIISGLIFAFNPYVWSHIHQLDLSALQWIPLIFLLTEKLIQRITTVRLVGFFSLLLIQLSSSFYYTFFLILTLPVYFLIRIYTEKINIRKFFKWSILIPAIAFLILGYLYLKPFIEVKSLHNVKRRIESVTLVSARPSDYFFTTSESRLYGWMVSNPFFQSLRHPYAALYHTEHSLFLGITPLFLFGLALYKFFTKQVEAKKRSSTKAFLIILGLSFLLSLGPYILVGERKIPFFYLLINKLVPLADSLRAISRFAIMGFFSISLIISLFWKGKLWLSILVIILILLEYNHSLPKPYPISLEVKNFYSWLNNQSKIAVILELPMSNQLYNYPAIYRDELADNLYLLYAVFHNKRLVNGYQAVIPLERVELGRSLIINFPNREKLEQLKKMGVDLIILHKREYNSPQQAEKVIRDLQSMNLKEEYASANISAFSFEQKENK